MAVSHTSPDFFATPDIRKMKVTRLLATQWMERNTHNVPYSDRIACSYAEDMTAGMWPFTADPIVFSRDGVLLNGQHRLSAVIKSGVTIEFMVMTGADPSLQLMMDTGRKRKFAHQLKLDGECYPNELAAVTRRVWNWQAAGATLDGWSEGWERQWDQVVTPSHAQLAATLAKEADSLRHAARHASLNARKAGVPQSVYGLCWWWCHQIPGAGTDAEFFFARFTDGEGLLRTDPVYELRRATRDSRRPGVGFAAGNGRDIRQICALTCKAWNLYRSGDRVQALVWKGGGAHPEKFPVPR